MRIPDPLVSVVIPTRDRPDLVTVAIRSALAQSLGAIEVIVVIDGPDLQTEESIQRIDDPRLRARPLPRPAGAPSARNAGVQEARGRWVAFLDDDDEWLPEKLALQYESARTSSRRHPIITCRVIARSPSGDFIWPRRFPRSDETIGEYLFCRTSPFFGEGLVPTNTIFTTRELLQAVPFDGALRDHEDLDWLLRVSAMEGVGIEFVARSEPLAIWHIEQRWSRMSDRVDWRYSLGWIRARRDLVTRRAYAAYVLTWLGATAARGRDRSAFLPLLREAWRHGSPVSVDLLSYLGYWLAPRDLQAKAAALFARRSLRSAGG